MKKVLLLQLVFALFFSRGIFAQNESQGNEDPNLNTKVLPVANFIANDTVICPGQYVTFTNLSTGHNTNSCMWIFEGGTPETDTLNTPPSILYNNPGEYDVTLIVGNSSGTDTLVLKDYITVEEVCEENYVFIPNIFTPNEDGANDVLIVRSTNLKEFHMFIYDRWGKKVFETTDGQSEWNGEIKGQKAEQGTYIYYIDVIYRDGEVDRIKGNFTLIR